MKLTEKDLEQIQEWCNALRSGEYNQTIGTLQDKQGCCCLGVACLVTIPKDKLIIDEDNGYLFGVLAHNQDNAPMWLKTINDHFKIKTSSLSRTNSFGTNEALSRLNDNHSLTFDEIADLVEAVYIHKVMD